ncbi:hypothetical protein [Propionivibrio sp.]|uniref:hypothetical protein n=1 Tax=Propionivibrio sp. TaxID=2212460 RepID=UPI002606B53C|nr:hypothetical protein [Propionivibrio sp.]
MLLRTWLFLLLLPVLTACSDLRATYQIKGSAHSLSLIRVTSYPWQKTAKYSIVAARMPDCMRRHPMSEAGLNARVEVYSPGNNAWILKQDGRMFVVETRTCEGFANLDKVPEDGLGPLLGAFEMRQDALVFTAAPRVEPPAPLPTVTAN